MKILVSYFYQIRYFKPYIIPLSTAMWDPKWYHNNKNQKHVWKDKNGVINGLRFLPFVPKDNIDDLDPLCRGPEYCKELEKDQCKFLEMYSKQLDKIDIDKLQQNFDSIIEKLKENNFVFEKEPIICLIVHEAPNNPCSERRSIFEWAKKNNIECKEFDRKDFK